MFTTHRLASVLVLLATPTITFACGSTVAPGGTGTSGAASTTDLAPPDPPGSGSGASDPGSAGDTAPSTTGGTSAPVPSGNTGSTTTGASTSTPDDTGPSTTTGGTGPAPGTTAGGTTTGGTTGSGGPVAVPPPGDTPEGAAAKLRAGFTSSLCASGLRDALSGVTPAIPTDYLELRQYVLDTGPSKLLSKQGTLCNGAASVPACQTDVASVDPKAGWVGPLAGFGQATLEQLIFTRGSVVGTITSKASLPSFLAPLGPSDAAFLADVAGYRVVCGENNVVSKDDGTYLLAATGTGCGAGNDVLHHVLFVTCSGAIRVLATWVFQYGDPRCQI